MGTARSTLRFAQQIGYGRSAVPTLDLTSATSTELITPFAFTSSRKFELETGWPTCDLVRLTSEAFTVRLAFVSPIRMLIGITTLVEPFTSKSVTLIVWALATLVSGTV